MESSVSINNNPLNVAYKRKKVLFFMGAHFNIDLNTIGVVGHILLTSAFEF